MIAISSNRPDPHLGLLYQCSILMKSIINESRNKFEDALRITKFIQSNICGAVSEDGAASQQDICEANRLPEDLYYD